MAKAALAVSLLAVLLPGCAHVTTVSHTAPRAPQAAMARQIQGAVDAGDGDAAVRELRRRILANPDDIKARMDLAQRYRDQGFPELAAEHLRLAVARAPHLSELHIRLAKALEDSGDTEAAIGTLVKFCNLEPLPPAELVSLLGIYEDRVGRYVTAELHHRRALALAPKRDLYHNNLGYNLLLQQRPSEAVAEFRRAVALNPRSEIARNNLGVALAKAPDGSPEEALLQWQSVSDPATAHSNLASVYMEQERYREAREQLEIALGYSHEHAAALANLAIVSELDGRPAAVAPQPVRTGAWHRFASGIRHAFTGATPAGPVSSGNTPPAAVARQ